MKFQTKDQLRAAHKARRASRDVKRELPKAGGRYAREGGKLAPATVKAPKAATPPKAEQAK